MGTSLEIQRLRLHVSKAGGPGLILGGEITLHLRVRMLKQMSKIPCTTIKTQHRQINNFLKLIKFLKKNHLEDLFKCSPLDPTPTASDPVGLLGDKVFVL